MKRIIYIFLSLIGLLGANEINQSGNAVVLINEQAISKLELDTKVSKLLPQAYYHAAVAGDKLEKVRQEALDALIEQELLYQYAKASGIALTIEEKLALKKPIVDALGSRTKYLEVLKQTGISEQAHERMLEKESVVGELYERDIKVTFSEQELMEYYKQNMHKFVEPQRVRVRIIRCNIDPLLADGKLQAEQKAKEAYEKVVSGADFAEVASQYSDDMTRVKGGDMGYIHEGMLYKALEEVAYALQEGQISDIIEDDIAFFILKVEEKTAERQLGFDQIKGSLKRDLIKSREESNKIKLLEKLKEKADIKIMM